MASGLWYPFLWGTSGWGCCAIKEKLLKRARLQQNSSGVPVCSKAHHRILRKKLKMRKWGSAQTHPSQIHIYCHPGLHFCFMKVMPIPHISSCGTMASPCRQRKTLTFVRAVSLTCSSTWILSHTLWNLSPAPAAQTNSISSLPRERQWRTKMSLHFSFACWALLQIY